jgi:hypothetical protein
MMIVSEFSHFIVIVVGIRESNDILINGWLVFRSILLDGDDGFFLANTCFFGSEFLQVFWVIL